MGKYYKKSFAIGKKCSPGAAPVVKSEDNVIMIKMSCGGGLGGACWYEYGSFVSEQVRLNELIQFKDYFTGEIKTLNPRYIVKIEDRKIVAVESDCTMNENMRCKSQIAYYLMARDAEYYLVDKCCVNVDKENAEVIKWETLY